MDLKMRGMANLMSDKLENEPHIPWFVGRIHAFAMQGMTKDEVLEATGLSRHAVWSALRGWTMNRRDRKLRAKAHESRGRSDRTSRRRQAKAEETRGPTWR